MRAFLAVPVAGALLSGLLIPTAAQSLIPPDTSCRSGRVALTFDDGPHGQNTPRLLRILREQRVQATFYVQGQNAVIHQKVLRSMVRDGHAVENHSWDHPHLTGLSDAAVRSQLARTSSAVRKATGQSPRYFRPPYGATDARVVAIGREANLIQQLWTVDSRDWTGLSSAEIARNAVNGVRKHRRNVILLHDGVTNSPRTIDAVPSIVASLRKRGFCLVPQQFMMVRQHVRIQPRRVTEPRSSSVVKKFVVLLDSPAQRRGRVLVTAVSGTAKAGEHFRRPPIWVRVKRGQTRATVSVRIYRVADENASRSFSLRLSRPRELQIARRHRATKVTIADNGVVAPTVEPPTA